jgi:hypothetical protein
MFSRSIVGGKKTAKMEARVSDELKEAMRRKWMDAGFNSEAEYLETLVSCDVFGLEHVRMVMDRRIASVCNVAVLGQESDGKTNGERC